MRTKWAVCEHGLSKPLVICRTRWYARYLMWAMSSGDPSPLYLCPWSKR